MQRTGAVSWRVVASFGVMLLLGCGTALALEVKPRLVFREHKNLVHAIAFSPDGRSLVSASDDGTVKLWETASGMVRLTMKGHEGRVHAVAIAPDGRMFASGG